MYTENSGSISKCRNFGKITAYNDDIIKVGEKVSETFNTAHAAKIKDMSLTDGRIYKDCFVDPTQSAPPGFIVLRSVYQQEGAPVVLTYIKVANIASFNIDETEQGKLWWGFRPLPEEMKVKN